MTNVDTEKGCYYVVQEAEFYSQMEANARLTTKTKKMDKKKKKKVFPCMFNCL